MTSFPHARGRRLAPALALALLPFAAPARADVPMSDAGTYRVYQKDQRIGTEDFWFLASRESLLVRARVSEVLPRPHSAPDTLLKTAQLLLSAGDHDIHEYVSQEMLNSQSVRRELSMEDTIYTSQRTFGLGGFSDVFVRPPGRLYVVDPQVFTLYHLMLRDVQQQSFEERGVPMLYIAGRDTTAEARVKRLGKEAVRIDGRLYPAEKFSVTDAWSEFIIWMSPEGRMMKLTLPLVGLRVERDPKTLSAKGAPSYSGSQMLPPPPPKVLR